MLELGLRTALRAEDVNNVGNIATEKLKEGKSKTEIRRWM
jgi:hypothetical protein